MHLSLKWKLWPNIAAMHLWVHTKYELLRIVHYVAIASLALKLKHICLVARRWYLIWHIVSVPHSSWSLWIIIKWSWGHTVQSVASTSGRIVWAARLIFLLFHLKEGQGVYLCQLLLLLWELNVWLVSFHCWASSITQNNWGLVETLVGRVGLGDLILGLRLIRWWLLVIRRLHQMTSVWKVMRRDIGALLNLNLIVSKTVKRTRIILAWGLLLACSLLSLCWAPFLRNYNGGSCCLRFIILVLPCQLSC